MRPYFSPKASKADLEREKDLIEIEVQSLCRDISFKFTPNPSSEEIDEDVITALGRFRIAARNKAKAYERKKKEVQIFDDDSDDPTNNGEDDDVESAQYPNPGDFGGLEELAYDQPEKPAHHPKGLIETWRLFYSTWRSN